MHNPALWILSFCRRGLVLLGKMLSGLNGLEPSLLGGEMQIKEADFWNNDRNHFLFQRLFLNEQEKWFFPFSRRSTKRDFFISPTFFLSPGLYRQFTTIKNAINFHSIHWLHRMKADRFDGSTNSRHSITINLVGFCVLGEWRLFITNRLLSCQL